jgi:hypothetical protein
MATFREKLYAKTFKFPGKWMPDKELEQLQQQLAGLGRRALGEVPDYGVYRHSRVPYHNRIITVVYTRKGDKPVAFSAMVVWQIKLSSSKKAQSIVHLGLVVVDPAYRGRKVMYRAYHRPLFQYFAGRFFRPFWITSTTMEPVIMGSVGDSFSRVFPHYLQEDSKRPPADHLEIAGAFVTQHGHEIGIAKNTWLDKEHFIIRGSSLGASRELMHDYEHTAKYRVKACNEFCRHHLRYDRGDEFIQVGRVDLPALWISAWWFLRKLKKWIHLRL